MAKVTRIGDKTVFVLAMVWIFTAAGLFWALLYIMITHQDRTVGSAVDCVSRPNWEVFKRCDARVSIACAEESQTDLMEFAESIDVACSRFEPERVFSFPINDPERVEVAEIN